VGKNSLIAEIGERIQIHTVAAKEGRSIFEIADEMAINLVAEMITAVDSANGWDDLSTALAVGGILPMFGFPTRIRNLYGKQLVGSFPSERDNQVIQSRPLELAVSMFAPGAELTAETHIHTANGIVEYEVGPTGRLQEVDNPFGDVRDVWHCATCSFALSASQIESEFGQLCPDCDNLLELRKMFQPAGFRTTYHSRPYDDIDGERTSTGATQINGNLGASSKLDSFNLWVTRPTSTEVLKINDNLGRLFTFSKDFREGGYTAGSTNLGRMAKKGVAKRQRRFGTVPDVDHLIDINESGILGVAKVTDVMALEIRDVNTQLGFIPVSKDLCPSARRAFVSFSELLRRQCAEYLDIDTNELEIGLQTYNVDRLKTLRIFIADTLDNGAGYAKELSKDETMKKVLEALSQTIQNDLNGDHALKCDSSCPDCLRSWDNRRLHGMLDWRLATTLFKLIEGGDGLDLQEWESSTKEVVSRFVENYSQPNGASLSSGVINGLHTVFNEAEGKCLILGNPLWAHTSYLNEYQVTTLLEAQNQFANIKMFDIDTLMQDEVVAANFLCQP
jgi:DEAD/DEAH box helicase domain-containing protein